MEKDNITKITTSGVKEKPSQETSHEVAEFIELCKEARYSAEKFQEIISEHVVKLAIPLQNKYTTGVILNSYLSLWQDEDPELFTAFQSEILMKYEAAKFGFMLCDYLSIPFDEKIIEVDFYNICLENGLVDYIENYVRNDYERYSKLVDRITGIDNYAVVGVLEEVLSDLPNNQGIKDFNAAIKCLDKVDTERLDKLYSLVIANNPELGKLVAGLKDADIPETVQKSSAEDKNA